MEYEDRIIAFVDILGFRDKVDKSKDSDEETMKIYNSLKRIHQRKIDNYCDSMFNMQSYGVEVSTFSDSAVISYPNKGDNLFWIIEDLIHLQFDLFMEDILIRGALTSGQLYHDKDIVFGPAMNDAYLAESKMAIYPRIIVNEKILKLCLENIKSNEDSIILTSMLRKDRDELFYIDMLSQNSEVDDTGIEYFCLLEKVKIIIEKGLEERNPIVRMKYQWLKVYFNDILTDKNRFFPVPNGMNKKDMLSFYEKYMELEIK